VPVIPLHPPGRQICRLGRNSRDAPRRRGRHPARQVSTTSPRCRSASSIADTSAGGSLIPGPASTPTFPANTSTSTAGVRRAAAPRRHQLRGLKLQPRPPNWRRLWVTRGRGSQQAPGSGHRRAGDAGELRFDHGVRRKRDDEPDPAVRVTAGPGETVAPPLPGKNGRRSPARNV